MKAFIAALVLICFSCEKDSQILEKRIVENNAFPSIDIRSGSGLPLNTPIYSDSELIVLWDSLITDGQKDTLRAFHGVFTHEVCQLCPDESIEKWFFGGPINIEPKRQAIEAYGGVEDVDYEFDFITTFGVIDPGSPLGTLYEPFIVPSNTGVTIAVMDTGYDPFFPFNFEYDGVTPNPILYNASETGVYDELSGWNFVDYHHNAHDDNPGKHGSVVSRCISNPLSTESIAHQILPLKICDVSGVTNYFKFLCASRYAFERADVIQMSLGWYDDGFGDFANTIFKLLADANEDVIVVCSAGNDTHDNDEEHHYPSSYENSNVIAVAATNETSSDIAGFSNFGKNSVDFFAVGQGIPFYRYNGSPLEYPLEGTSFAAPQIASVVARLLHFYPGSNSEEIRSLLSTSGFSVPTGYADKTLYDKYYPLLVD